jgi:hypothetical protein
MVSTETPGPLDVDSIMATLQYLSAAEIALAHRLHATWEGDQQAAGYGLSTPNAGEETAFYMKRPKAAGLIESVPPTDTLQLRTPRYTLTPTLLRLVRLLQMGRAGISDAEIGSRQPEGR